MASHLLLLCALASVCGACTLVGRWESSVPAPVSAPFSGQITARLEVSPGELSHYEAFFNYSTCTASFSGAVFHYGTVFQYWTNYPSVDDVLWSAQPDADAACAFLWTYIAPMANVSGTPFAVTFGSDCLSFTERVNIPAAGGDVTRQWVLKPLCDIAAILRQGIHIDGVFINGTLRLSADSLTVEGEIFRYQDCCYNVSARISELLPMRFASTMSDCYIFATQAWCQLRLHSSDCMRYADQTVGGEFTFNKACTGGSVWLEVNSGPEYNSWSAIASPTAAPIRSLAPAIVCWSLASLLMLGFI